MGYSVFFLNLNIYLSHLRTSGVGNHSLLRRSVVWVMMIILIIIVVCTGRKLVPENEEQKFKESKNIPIPWVLTTPEDVQSLHGYSFPRETHHGPFIPETPPTQHIYSKTTWTNHDRATCTRASSPRGRTIFSSTPP